MTFASLLLRLLMCIALVAGTGVPLPSTAMASHATADAPSDAGMPCHGDEPIDTAEDARAAAADSVPAADDACCDGACACQCIVPAVAMPDVAIAALEGLPPARPHAVLRTPRAPPPVEFPTRPPIATA